jgi:hypothetical protein
MESGKTRTFRAVRSHSLFRRSALTGALAAVLVLAGGLAAGAAPTPEETPAPAVTPAPTDTPSPSDAPAPAEDATPEPATEVVVAPDDVLLDIEGTLLVTYTAYPAASGERPADPERRVSLAIGERLIELTGEVPLDARTGDRIAATAVVPDEVVASVPVETLADIPSDAPVAQDSDAGEEILETASASSAPLEVADSEIVTANAIVGTPAAHEIRFVTVTAGGSTASYTPATLGGYAGTYWTDQSNGLISSMTVGSNATTSTSSCPATGTAANALLAQGLTALGLGSDIDAFLAADDGVHVVLVLPSTCLTVTGLSLGSLGSSVHSNGVTIMSKSTIDRTTLIRQIGHNLGLGPADAGICDADATAIGCIEYEYGDFYDVMGFTAGASDTPTELGVREQYLLGFVDDADVPLIELTGGDTDESFPVDLSGMSGDSTANPLGYRVKDPVTGEILFLEYRDGEADAFYSDPDFIGEYGFDYDDEFILAQTGIRLVGEASSGGSLALAREGYAGDPDNNGYYFLTTWQGSPFTSPSGGIRATVDSCATGACDDITVTLRLRTAPAGATQPVFRFWSDAFQAHFYTMSVQERDYVIANYDDYVWKYEKVAYRAYSSQEPGTVPLYRFWSDTYRGHFYTASQSERDYIIANYPTSVWKYEKIAYYVYPASNDVPNTIGVFRFWSTSKGHHFYTANPIEREIVIADYDDWIWKYERKAFEVPKS